MSPGPHGEAAWRDASGALHINRLPERDPNGAQAWDDAPNSVTGGQCLDTFSTEEARIDALFGRVFATPDGGDLLAHLRSNGRRLALDEIQARLYRQRRRWERGPHNSEHA